MIDFNKKMQELEKEERLANGQWDETLLINNKKRKKIVTYTIAILVIAIIFSGRILMSSQNATNWIPGISFLNKLKHLVPIASRELKGEPDDRINILLLGMGGEGHDGAYLTDTMIITSVKPTTKQVAMFSVPRDLVAPVSNWRKINSVNAYAEQANPGSGGEVSSEAFSTLFQIPIHYYIRADFEGFSRVIDELGGVDVNVENTFDDYSYPADGQEDNPNYNARFEHLHIDKGWQKMNGTLALKYARSRHAYGIEGSDFARARRQQLLLEAIKAKLLSTQTLLNPVVIGKLINEFNKDISTNLSVWEMLRLWDISKDINREQINSQVFSDAPDGFLMSGKGEDGAYILTPRSGNFSEIRKLIQNIFNDGTSSAETVDGGLSDTVPKKIFKQADTSSEPQVAVLSESASIIINNGTWVSGLASKTSQKLTKYNFSVIKTGNAPERTYEKTVIYDLSQGQKTSALSALEKLTGGQTKSDSPIWLEEYKTTTSTPPDFILILGTDANKAE